MPLALTSLIAYATASVWYITNHTQLKVDLLQNGVAAGVREGDPLVGTLSSNIWYLINLLSRQLYLIPAVLVGLGLWMSLRHRQSLKRNRYPLLLMLGTLAFFTLLRNKDARYTLPMVPASIIIGSTWLASLKPRWQRWTSGLLITYAAISFYAISFGIPALPADITYLVGSQPATLFGQHGYIIGSPTHEDWGLEDAFRQAANLEPGKRSLSYSGPDTMWLNGWDLQYYARRYGVALAGPDQASLILIRQQTTDSKLESKGAIIWSKVLPDGSLADLYQAPAKE